MYGYGAAQLRQTMLVSGLAAVVGVVVVWTAAQGTSDATMAGLAAAIVVTPAYLLTAAAFGLTPGLLLDRVHSWAKTNVGELEVTATGEGSAETTPIS